MQDFPPKTLCNDDKVFSKLLSKEKYNSSKQGEASFRVLYYGGATGAVPFVWESQPGTPKHTLSDHRLPPLTPPPSYVNPKPNNLLHKKNSKKSKILQSLFSRVHSKKIDDSHYFSPSSSFSSAYSLPPTTFSAKKGKKTRSSLSSSSIFDFGSDDEKYERGMMSPTSTSTSTSCFGPKNGRKKKIVESFDFLSIKSVKKVVLSIVGHGTAK